MVVTGSCIGIGIFLTPALIAENLPSPGWIMVVWLMGGISTLCAAFTFGELASRYPDKAGMYYWLKEAYGDFWGFLFGWFYITVLVSGAIAAISLGFAQYANEVFPGAVDRLGFKGTAAVLISIICVVNCIGLRWGDWSTRILTLLKAGGLLLIVGVGLALRIEEPEFHLQLVSSESDGSLVRRLGMAFAGVSFSYAGIQYASFLAVESRNAIRTIAWGMTLGVMLVSLLYLLTNYAYLLLIPVQVMALSEVPAAAAISVTGFIPDSVVPLVIMVSAAGTVAAFTLAAPRMYQSMAEEQLFFAIFRSKHSRFQTPVHGIIIQSVWAVFWVLFWGTFAGVLTHLVITNLMFMVSAAFAIYLFRLRLGVPTGFRSPGYPAVPAVYIVISGCIILTLSISSPLGLSISALFALFGWGFYRYGLLRNAM